MPHPSVRPVDRLQKYPAPPPSHCRNVGLLWAPGAEPLRRPSPQNQTDPRTTMYFCFRKPRDPESRWCTISGSPRRTQCGRARHLSVRSLKPSGQLHPYKSTTGPALPPTRDRVSCPSIIKSTPEAAKPSHHTHSKSEPARIDRLTSRLIRSTRCHLTHHAKTPQIDSDQQCLPAERQSAAREPTGQLSARVLWPSPGRLQRRH